MGQHYMPRRLADQVAWLATFVSVVSPSVADYGVPTDKMDALVAANSQAQSAWTVISRPETRTRPALEAFRTALKTARAAAADAVHFVRAKNVTPEMLTAAGLTIPKTTRTTNKRPKTRPVATVDSVVGRDVTLRVQGEDARRARPEDAQGYYVYWAAGDIAPTDPSAWTWAGLYTKLTAELKLPATVAPDAKVWFACNWVGPTGLTGPACNPVGAFLNRDGAPIAVAPPLKIAA